MSKCEWNLKHSAIKKSFPEVHMCVSSKYLHNTCNWLNNSYKGVAKLSAVEEHILTFPLRASQKHILEKTYEWPYHHWTSMGCMQTTSSCSSIFLPSYPFVHLHAASAILHHLSSPLHSVYIHPHPFISSPFPSISICPFLIWHLTSFHKGCSDLSDQCWPDSDLIK